MVYIIYTLGHRGFKACGEKSAGSLRVKLISGKQEGDIGLYANEYGGEGDSYFVFGLQKLYFRLFPVLFFENLIQW